MEYNLQILQISDYKYTQSKQVTVKITIQLRNSSKKKKKKKVFLDYASDDSLPGY